MQEMPSPRPRAGDDLSGDLSRNKAQETNNILALCTAPQPTTPPTSAVPPQAQQPQELTMQEMPSSRPPAGDDANSDLSRDEAQETKKLLALRTTRQPTPPVSLLPPQAQQPQELTMQETPSPHSRAGDDANGDLSRDEAQHFGFSGVAGPHDPYRRGGAFQSPSHEGALQLEAFDSGGSLVPDGDPETQSADLDAPDLPSRTSSKHRAARKSSPLTALAQALERQVAKQQAEPPKELTSQQYKAIELLLSGEREAKVADQIGVHRGTLWRWRQKDADFRRALSHARERAFYGATDRLRELVPKSLEVLESQLEEGDHQAALRILRLARVDRDAPRT